MLFTACPEAGKVTDKKSFTFETGNESNHTQPGPHILAGYLTLYGSESGTGYVMAQEPGESAPDFKTLRSQTPDYQSYSLKKEQAQWMPILALKSETDYNIYVGVEFEDGSSYIETYSSKTTGPRVENIAEGVDVGLINSIQTESGGYFLRKIKFYPGQTLVFPFWYGRVDPATVSTAFSVELFYAGSNHSILNSYNEGDPSIVGSTLGTFQLLSEVTLPGDDSGMTGSSIEMKFNESFTGGKLAFDINNILASFIYNEYYEVEMLSP